MIQRSICLLALAAAIAAPASAQQYVFPAKGQTPEKQKSDEAACYTWAVQQTGFDPAKPPPTAAAPTTATGTQPGAGARGAARGAVVGGIMGDAGTGAAVGAVAARGQSRRQNAATQQQQGAATEQQQAAFAKARGACLEGKGYTVK
ncbi:MAG TPA: hypothetical protein VLD35_01805 [Caldimonas sp.]|nr:hypothetical protein [Caldimonas sp.]